MKRFFVASLIGILSLPSFGQSSTNSPYSQYGLGVLSEPAGGASRGMNGLGLGFHESNRLNSLNPASYSQIDSLTFLFDAGLSGEMTNFKEGGVRKNAKTASFEYVMGGFRLMRHLGLSFGVLPYTNVGYTYSSTSSVGADETTSTTSYTNTYSGSGGVHYVYLGAGWQPFKGFSIGANIGYLWGGYDKYVVNSYTDDYVNTLSKYYGASIKSYKLDVGLQYTVRLSKHDELTLGATYGLGHKLGADPECKVISTNAQTGVTDTTAYAVRDGLEIPASYAVGLLWSRNGRIKIGVDYSLQKWSEVKAPTYTLVSGTPQYVLESGHYNDRHKVTVGTEIRPNGESRKYLNRVCYRLGASYTTPYLKINGADGPKEISVSAGLGLPITNRINNRSMLNISAQWVHLGSKQFITENSFRINIGLTFNERWFAKWKME